MASSGGLHLARRKIANDRKVHNTLLVSSLRSQGSECGTWNYWTQPRWQRWAWAQRAFTQQLHTTSPRFSHKTCM
eukprot:2897589-Amphidinium_carterae.1